MRGHERFRKNSASLAQLRARRLEAEGSNYAAVPDGHTTVSLVVPLGALIPPTFVVATYLSFLNTDTALNTFKFLPNISEWNLNDIQSIFPFPIYPEVQC